MQFIDTGTHLMYDMHVYVPFRLGLENYAQEIKAEDDAFLLIQWGYLIVIWYRQIRKAHVSVAIIIIGTKKGESVHLL